MFNLYAGTITGNWTLGELYGFSCGGGVFVNTMQGGKCTFNMYGGNITDNYASYGGGVYVEQTEDNLPAHFNMYGGSITDNYAGWGGGVYVEQTEDNPPAHFNMYGGTITGNRASSKGGGVYFNNDGFTIAPENGKSVTIQDNLRVDSMEDTEGTANNVFVYNGQTIKIGSALNNSKIGITEEGPVETFTVGYPANNPDTDPCAFFTSDDPQYIAVYDENQEVTLSKGVQITFKVKNGTWADGTSAPIVKGILFPEGKESGTLLESDIPAGMIPAEHYENGKWTPAPDLAEGAVKQELTYIYRFTEKPKYSVTYTDGVDDEEAFADQVYAELYSGADTPNFEGSPVRNGYEFLGWTPTVSEQVTGDVIYTAQWKKTSSENPDTPSRPTQPSNPDKPSEPTVPGDAPNTGDNSHMLLWFALLAAAGGLFVSLTAVHKKQRER